MENADLKKELKRKSIHLSSCLYPIIYFFSNKNTVITILWVVFLALLVWEIARFYNIKPKMFNFFYNTLRTKETTEKHFTGAFWMIISFLLVVSFFSKNAAILSMFIVLVCDTVASIIGIKYGGKLLGKVNIFNNLNKSLEGFLGFIISGIIIVHLFSLVTAVNPYLLYIPVFLTAIVELYSKKIKIDDNLTITICFAIISYLFIGVI